MKSVKLKAGALQMTLFVIVVIALLLGAFVLLTHLNKLVSVKTDFAIETVNNANKGINYSLYNETQYNKPILMDLADESFKSVTVRQDAWGMFQRVSSKSKIKTFEFSKTALIGVVRHKTHKTALYLENTNKPLVVVGTTRIEGDAYVSDKGIRPGNISGQSYYGTALLNGVMKLSSQQLPPLNKNILNTIKAYQDDVDAYSNDQFFSLDTTNSYSNSFFDPVKIAYSTNAIILDYKKISGHVIIKSEISINVSSTSNLKDIILIAPKIIIDDTVKSNFQAIATNSISVGENVQLSYPSALVLNPKSRSNLNEENSSSSTNQIIINEGAVVKGCVVSLGQKISNNYNTHIHIKETSKVYGELYCKGKLELEGTVYGSVYTSIFVAHQNGSVYQNHIYNGKILANDLIDQYAGLSFNNGNKQIMQWLY